MYNKNMISVDYRRRLINKSNRFVTQVVPTVC